MRRGADLGDRYTSTLDPTLDPTLDAMVDSPLEWNDLDRRAVVSVATTSTAAAAW
ncbi:MAG: hypothetical protein ICV70_05745 [Jiangellaceae bacterium]|nr:hypothetical protein [Jiangellaceae bacterium]